MNSAEVARTWMLLQTEKSLGLESVRWKLNLPAPAAKSQPVPPPAMRAAMPQRQPPAAFVPRRPAATAPSGLAQQMPAAASPAAPSRPMPVAALQEMASLAQGVSLTMNERISAMDSLNNNHVKGCTKCRLHQTRTNTVFGEGALDAQLMFIGEGPGETEDETGRPFVGRAGQLLGNMIKAMGLSREQVYISNIVKCRPPENRTPLPDEVAACTPYLVQQIQAIRPKVIVTLGLPATQYILSTNRPMRDLRGIWHEWHGIKVMPTYHPSYVLRSYTVQVRGAVWSDLQQVMGELGLSTNGQQFTR